MMNPAGRPISTAVRPEPASERLQLSGHKQMDRFALSLLATLVLPATGMAQESAEKPAESPPKGALRMAESPSLRLGDHLRVDLHARVQTDLRLDDSDRSSDAFSWGSRRVGLEGVLFKRVEFQIERELKDDKPWRDVFADVRLHRVLRIRAGRFKVPFSMERTTSAFELDFVTRAAPVADLAPGRETGVMAHGRLPRRLIEYEVGLFRLDSSPVEPFVEESVNRLTMTAARITVSPLRAWSDGPTSDLQLGLAVTESDLPEGFHHSSEHFASAEGLSSEQFYVNGRRRRLGLEGLWRAGRLSLKGELIRQADAREGAAVTSDALSDLVVRGGYVSCIWRLAGETSKARRAVDIALRFDRLAFGGGRASDQPSVSPRTEHVAPLLQNTWTVGASWLANRWLRVQFNETYESLADPLNVRQSVPAASWRSVVRAQFAM
jgi:phosphate-selective porin